MMVRQTTPDNVGAVPREVSADAGYYVGKVGFAQSTSSMLLDVDPFVRAGADTRHGRVVPPAPRGSHTQPSVLPRDRMPTDSYRPGGVGSATLCGLQTVELGIRPPSRQGRGFRQFLLDRGDVEKSH